MHMLNAFVGRPAADCLKKQDLYCCVFTLGVQSKLTHVEKSFLAVEPT